MENKVLSDRGFKGSEFTDHYGTKCSLQESSMVATEGDGEGFCIWLGIDEPEVKVFRPQEGGWKDVSIPEDALRRGRMHLSQRQVGELIPHLIYFAETGILPNAEQHAEFVEHLRENVQPTINDFFSEVST